MKNMLQLFILACVLVLTACVEPKFDPKKDYSFKVDSNDSVFANPPKNKARIYFYRKSGYFGSMIRYNVSAHYGELDTSNPFQSNYEFAFFSTPGFAYYVDIDSDKRVTLYAKTERSETFSFVPKADSIYCFETTLKTGFFVGVPKFILDDSQRCKANIAKLLQKSSKETWEKHKKAFDTKRKSSN